MSERGRRTWFGALSAAPVVDDRGAKHVASQPLATREEAAADPELWEMIDRIGVRQHERLYREPLKGRQVGLIAVYLCCLFGGAMLLSSIGGLVGQYGIGLLCCVLGVLLLRAWGDVAENSRERVRTLLAARRCGACCFRLEGIEVAADGCVVCPECGAAWKQARLGIASGATVASAGPARLLGWSGPVVNDERGRVVRIVEAGGIRTSIEDERAEGLRDAVRRRTRVMRWVRVIGSAVGLVLVIAATYHGLRTARANWMSASFWVFFLFGMSLNCVRVGLLGWRGRSQRFAGDWKEEFLHHGVCPGCGEDLSGVSPVADGVTECARCGCGWRLNRAMMVNGARCGETG